MGLATVIRKHRRKSHHLRFLVLGLDNAGKSTLISEWIKDSRHEGHESTPTNDTDTHPLPIAPTFGLSIHTLSHHQASSSKTLTIALWDIGGQAGLRSFWRTYYSPLVHCLIFVIDMSDVHRMHESVQWLHRMYKEVNEGDGGDMTITKVVIIGNKTDLCTDPDVVAIGTRIEDAFRGAHFMTCSAKTGKDVRECFEGVIRVVTGQ